jgi:CRP/FNR family cyclic AMP-dependent transcriptional regulator
MNSRIIRLACDPKLLKTLRPFSSLTEAQFTALAPSIEHRKYAARAYILRAGEKPDGLYFILSGEVRLVLHGSKGRDLIVAAIGRDEFFGEAIITDAEPLATSVQSHEHCEVLYVPRHTLLKLLQYSPGAAIVMLRAMINRLSDAHRRIASLFLVDVYGRVMRVLLEHGRDTKGEWIVDVGSEQIAAMVGASREMVSRVIKDMISKGAVRRCRRKLIVLNRALLSSGRVKS